MNKDNKYYNLVEKLVKQNKKFTGNEQYLDEIIDDVLNHANSIMESINNESVIEEFLNKIVSTSIITVSKKMNRNVSHSSSAQKLINKINNQVYDKEVTKGFVDNFINGSSDKSIDNSLSDEIIASENIPIHYDQLSEIIESNDLMIESDEPIVSYNTSEKISESDIDNTFEQNTLLEESLKLFHNSETEDIPDYTDNSDTDENTFTNDDTIEQQNDILEINSNDDSVVQTDSDEIQELDLIELSDNENDNPKEIEKNEATIDNSEFNIEDVNDNQDFNDIENSQEVTSVFEDSDLSLEELDNADSSEELHIETDEYDLEDADYVTDENILNISDDKESNSLYKILSYERKPSELSSEDINAEKIIEAIKSLNTEYPELNILDVYKLRFKELKEINNISNTLNMENDEVIKALNLMVNVV